ncbi:MAG: hypothetical protein ACOC2H_03710 [Spirochaetota bacterium]
MVRYNDININITPSGAKDVHVSYSSNGTVHLDFMDYLEKKVNVTFSDVMAFRYIAIDEDAVGRKDQIYEVLESEWLKTELSDYSEEEQEALTHFIFCFDTYNKAFHVICSRDFDFSKSE